MRILFAMIMLLNAWCCSSALAIVGTSRGAGAAASFSVMVLNQKGRSSSFCTGIAIARDVVITAAHCVHRADSVAVYVPSGRTPSPVAAARIVIHPRFVANAIRSRRRSIDLAVIQTSRPLPLHIQPIGIAHARYNKGTNFEVAGYGFRREGKEASAGRLRTIALQVRPPISSILLWLRSSTRRAAGACTGDSGGPIYLPATRSVVALIVWARGRGKRRCGELTQGLILKPHRRWIFNEVKKWRTR